MRIALAKLLLQKPCLLLLDEPTNHLDLESRNWLENYLHDYPNAYILISHDRYFLDVTVNKTIELWNKRMHVYHGNYEKYVAQKEERRTQLMNAYKNQRDRIEALEAFINRFRYQATKAKQVQSRIKELEKIERIEVPEEEATIHFTIPAAARLRPHRHGSLRTSKRSTPPRTAAKNSSSTTSTSPSSAATASPSSAPTAPANPPSSACSASRKSPPPATSATATTSSPTSSPRTSTKSSTPTPSCSTTSPAPPPKSPSSNSARSSAASCSPATTSSKNSASSPAASATATPWPRCSSRPSNFLLLDEPTNHLDLRAKDVLLDAIRNFTGTVLFVSHDRYFIDGLATRVFEVEDRRVHIYPGNYEDYLYRKTGIPTDTASLAAQVKTETSTGARIDAATGMLKPVAQVGKTELASPDVSSRPGNLGHDPDRSAQREVEGPAFASPNTETLVIASEDFDAEPWESTHELEGSLTPVTPAPKLTAKRLNPIKLKQMEDRVAAIEDELSDLDARISQAEQQQAVFTTAESARALAAELETLREQHATRTAEWESLASQLEEQTTA